MKISQQPQIIPSTQDLLHGILIQKDLSKFVAKTKSHDEINIVYFGTPAFSAYILEKLIEFCNNPPAHKHFDVRSSNEIFKRYSVQTVITRADKPVGRKQVLTSSPVSLVAAKYGIPALKPQKLDEDFIKNHLPLLECDLFIVASYGKIIPKTLLDIPRLNSLNVHGSILPKYRGASPIQAAILNGEHETGVTIMLMDEEMDHGPILTTKEISISEQDTFESLSNKMAQIAASLLIDSMVKLVKHQLKPKQQNHAQATFTKLIKKESGYFDIDNPPPPEILDRMIRAYHPWPGVWTKWNGKIVKFLPGNMLQMEGKKPISYKDFLNGYPDFPLKSITLDKK